MDAARDGNKVPTMLATLDSDGTTEVRIEADPSAHTLTVENNTTGSDNGPTDAGRDENKVPVALAASSAGDGSIVALYADSDGNLLVDST